MNLSDGWIDVSVPLKSGMVCWDDDGKPQIEQTLFMERGDLCNLSQLRMSAHTGTHMDAPRHFLRDGAPMGTLPLDAVIGRARVIEIHDPRAVRAAELAPARPQAGERVLFKTTNSALRWSSDDFQRDFVYIAAGAARMLADAGIRTVGVDYLSVGGYSNDLVETHEILLGAGIWIIEGLNLAAIAPGDYEMICLPLSIPTCDGAPARAVLRPLPA
jgi:arylformamidase